MTADTGLIQESFLLSPSCHGNAPTSNMNGVFYAPCPQLCSFCTGLGRMQERISRDRYRNQVEDKRLPERIIFMSRNANWFASSRSSVNSKFGWIAFIFDNIWGTSSAFLEVKMSSMYLWKIVAGSSTVVGNRLLHPQCQVPGLIFRISGMLNPKQLRWYQYAHLLHCTE